MRTWLRAVVVVVLVSACGSGGTGSGSGATTRSDGGKPDDAGVERDAGAARDAGVGRDAGAGPDAGRDVPEVGRYVGSVRSTYHVIDIIGGTGTSQTRTSTNDVVVEVLEPFEVEGGGAETNPFHLEISPRTLPLEPGGLIVSTAVEEPQLNPPPDAVVMQYWTYAFAAGARRQFDGKLTRPLTADPSNTFASQEYGGPMSMPPNNAWETCVGVMHRDTALHGTFDGDRLEIEIVGTAGGYLVGLTCMTEFDFEAHVSVTRQANKP